MKKILSWAFVYLPAGFVIGSVLLVTILKWAPVTLTPLMVLRYWQNLGDRAYRPVAEWVPLENVSHPMVTATIAAEDARFFDHHGFDYEEISRMQQGVLFDGSKVRGCSTISQQTAKNCFTFCSHTWARKALEAYYTVLIETIWGKERILEVYLNVAEMGHGLYGVEAAANRYFDVPASRLTLADASSLVCCLPNPLHRSPDWVNTNMAFRRAEVAKESVKISSNQ